MTRLSTFLVCFTLFGLSSCFIDKTVYQYLVDNGYSSFVQLVGETNLQSMLDGKGPVTVFAPSNDVVAKLSPDVMATLAHNPGEKVSLIKYHILDQVVVTPQIGVKQTYKTIEGESLEILHIGNSLILNNVTRVAAAPNNDIVCSNGVVQPIDQVLTPPVFGGDNIAAVLIEKDDLFQEFLLSIMLANMTSLLETGEYTLFAPINTAYTEFKKNIFSQSVPVAERYAAYREIMKYHIVPGKRTASMLKNGQVLYTLHGLPLNVTVMTAGNVILNQFTNVVQADISASNGVIHAVDHLMFPGDLKNVLNSLYQQSLIG